MTINNVTNKCDGQYDKCNICQNRHFLKQNTIGNKDAQNFCSALSYLLDLTNNGLFCKKFILYENNIEHIEYFR